LSFFHKFVIYFLGWLQTKAPEKETPTTARDNKTSGEKKKDKSAGKTAEKASEKALEKTADKDSECNISILNIQVGLIRKAWKHPSADRYSSFTLSQCFGFFSMLLL
jgi:hypothetical protein